MQMTVTIYVFGGYVYIRKCQNMNNKLERLAFSFTSVSGLLEAPPLKETDRLHS